jgi:hypothetical protein
MAEQTSGFWATLWEELSGQYQSPKVGLAAANVQANGLNPDGTFIDGVVGQISFFMQTGIDPADSAAVKAQINKIGADSNAFFDQQYQKNWDTSPISSFAPTLPSIPSLPSLLPSGSSLIVIGVVVLIVLFVILKAVK